MMIIFLCFLTFSWSVLSENDSKCEGSSVCLPGEDCEYYQAQLLTLTKSWNRELMLKLRALVCNKTDRKICCPTGSQDSQKKVPDTPKDQEYPKLNITNIRDIQPG